MDIISQGLPLLTILCNSLSVQYMSMLVALIVTELVTAAAGGIMTFRILSGLEERLISKLAVGYGHEPTSDIPFSHSLDFAQYKVRLPCNNSDRLFILTCSYVRRVAYQRQFVIMWYDCDKKWHEMIKKNVKKIFPEKGRRITEYSLCFTHVTRSFSAIPVFRFRKRLLL